MDKLGVNNERLILPHEPYFCQGLLFLTLRWIPIFALFDFSSVFLNHSLYIL